MRIRRNMIDFVLIKHRNGKQICIFKNMKI